MASSTDTKTIITLKGSVAIVSEFFFTAINSILYQRGIYQPETFRRESKYGLTVLTTTDEGLLEYLNNIMGQMETWLLDGDVQRLVLVVSGIDSGETLERWQFNVDVDEKKKKKGSNVDIDVDGAGPTGMDVDVKDENDAPATNVKKEGKSGKTIKEIHNEIQAIIRQITASVSALFDYPLLFYVICDIVLHFILLSKICSPAWLKIGDIPSITERAMFLRHACLHQ